MYIDGQFEPGRGDAWIDVINPATEALLSRIPDGSAEDARRAILAAERAQPGWEALPAIERAGWLRKIAAGIRERAEEIAALIVAEGGKIQQLAAVEVSLPPIIWIIWPNGRAVMKVKLCRATGRGKIFWYSSARWA
jgi:lactaldehyde dehydrogenase/glycolaldehyde dehydrogenase